MNAEIYSKLIVGEDEPEDAPLTYLTVTQELNLFGIWETVGNHLPKLVKWFRDYERDAAIEFAVDLGRKMLSQRLSEKGEVSPP